MSERDPMTARDPLDSISGLDEGERILPPDTSILDVLDNVLHKGVMIHGEVIIGLAGIDLVYLSLTAVLCAADRILPPDGPRSPAGSRTSLRDPSHRKDPR